MNRTDRYTATNLADTITAQGRQQRWIAESIGVSESFMSKVISGTKSVNRRRAGQIASLLGVPIVLVFRHHNADNTASQKGSPAA